ncbi:conserved hypothetical protein [Pediculus humanus corporis]|uniref:Uncharacterized protein n=1 Tax=Pediculus humanus subsp. corporis TaxID=121224 RepID=E0VFJ8_PEDHC|nr:uncharacterized protein Phum_PHUM159200 [Pediculus humanus corporis]EEB12154.1 conserved hypothetical protein [Pediculus humanus corporis]
MQTGRPPSTQSFTNKTASRMSTGMMQQPPRTTQSVLGMSNINVLDRPITQQGVAGLRMSTSSRGPQIRQVKDKRYYEGLLRMKMKDIQMEMNRLNEEIELETQQQATSQVYEKRVREIASELTGLQGQLADYNLVIDKVNTNTDKAQIDAETEELKNENERLTENLNELFEQNRMKENLIQQLEDDVQNEKNVTFKLIEEMNENERKKYQELKVTNENLQKEIDEDQQELEMLTRQKLDLEDRISGSQIKQETVRLYYKLREREDRKAILLEEEKTRSTPAQEREKLLQKVKEDNAEMAAIDRQINHINEEIKKKKDELEMTEQKPQKKKKKKKKKHFRDLEKSQTDRHKKFKELKKREETMEQFLSTFQDSEKEENDKIQDLENKIVETLERMSKNLTGVIKLPSRDEFYLMKENLTLKEEELRKSKLTVEELNIKREKLTNNMKKIENLEEKIQEETVSLREKMKKMAEEMNTFSDLDDLRNKAKEKRENLLREKDDLNKSKTSLSKIKMDLKKQNEQMTKELNENETYVHLNNLEKKLQLLEQNNNSVKEFIDAKKTEMDGSRQQTILSLILSQ